MVKTDNEEFNKKFIIQPEEEQNVRDILTPHIVDCIVAMSSGYGGKIYMSFLKKGQLHIAIQTEQPFFTLSRGKIEVDELMWVDTLYLGRESSVCVQFEQASEEEEEL